MRVARGRAVPRRVEGVNVDVVRMVIVVVGVVAGERGVEDRLPGALRLGFRPLRCVRRRYGNGREGRELGALVVRVEELGPVVQLALLPPRGRGEGRQLQRPVL